MKRNWNSAAQAIDALGGIKTFAAIAACLALASLSAPAQSRGSHRTEAHAFTNAAGQAFGPSSTPASIARYKTNWLSAPLSFEPNQGQSAPDVQFLSRGKGYSIFLTPGEVILDLEKQDSTAPDRMGAAPIDSLRMELIGASRDAAAAGLDPQRGVVSYFVGNDAKKWRSGIPTFGRVRYSRIYPGVDLVFYGNQRQLECDFAVAPGADPGRIAWRIEGARASIDRSGDLVLDTLNGRARLKKPFLYQMDGKKKVQAAGSFVLDGNRVAFKAGKYDRSKELIIDPVLTYASYLGGSGTDNIGFFSGPGIFQSNPTQGLAIDNKGSVYVAGYTTSTDFPTTKGTYAPAPPKTSGAPSVFVSKFNAEGSSLEYSTYIGGSGWDQAFAIAVDSGGNAYVTGQTNSDDFPITSGAYQSLCYPAPANPPNQPTSDCGSDQSSAFVTKLNSTGTELVYSTFLGGYGGDYGSAIAVDGSGRAYVAGMEDVVCNPADYTYPSCFPTTTGAVIDGAQPSSGGAYYSFVTVFDPTGATLLYSTLFGDLNGLKTSTNSGNGGTLASALTVDSNGNFYLAGFTQAGKLPTTPGVVQPTSGPIQTGGYNIAAWRGMIAKFYPVDPNGGSSLAYATYFGGKRGSTEDFISGITTDPDGNLYLLGNTNYCDIPTTQGAYEPVCGPGPNDYYANAAFVTKLDPTGTSIVWSTYIGGAKQDGGDDVPGTDAIALDEKGNVYIEGTNSSNEFPFVNPVEPPAWGVLIAELDPTGSQMLFATKIGTTDIAGGVNAAGMAVDSVGNIYLAGNTDAWDLITTPGAFQTTSPDGPSYVGLGNGFVAKISPRGKATAKLVVTPNQTEYGELTTLTATIAPPSQYASAPLGEITFLSGRSLLGRALLNSQGVAGYSTRKIPPGSYSITADFPGDSTYGALSATANLKVKAIQAAMPDIAPGSGIITSIQRVRIKDGTPGRTIYYTTNGQMPTATPAEEYKGAITVSSTETIKAIAVANYYLTSGLAKATYTARFPGLVETAVSDPPASVSAGGSFTVTDTVKNIGLSAAATTSLTRYYLSTATSLTAGSYLLKGSRWVPALAVNAASSPTNPVTVTVPSGVAPASYFLLACADDTNTVAEADPGKRCKASSTEVAVTGQ